MALKKSTQADLQNKRLLFFEIGLCVSLFTTVLVFSCHRDKVAVDPPVLEPDLPVIIEEAAEITRQDRRPPTPRVQQQVRMVSEVIQIVKNETEITTEIEFDDFADEIITAAVSAGTGPAAGTGTMDFGDEIYIKVEEEPKFMGRSWEAFSYWVARQIKYPKAAIKGNIQGQVKIRFVIEKNGSISNIEVLSSPSPILSEEALRVIRESPAEWTPGKQRNTPVRLRFEIPVDFHL